MWLLRVLWVWCVILSCTQCCYAMHTITLYCHDGTCLGYCCGSTTLNFSFHSSLKTCCAESVYLCRNVTVPKYAYVYTKLAVLKSINQVRWLGRVTGVGIYEEDYRGLLHATGLTAALRNCFIIRLQLPHTQLTVSLWWLGFEYFILLWCAYCLRVWSCQSVSIDARDCERQPRPLRDIGWQILYKAMRRLGFGIGVIAVGFW